MIEEVKKIKISELETILRDEDYRKYRYIQGERDYRFKSVKC